MSFTKNGNEKQVTGRIPSEKVRIVAARVRVNSDKQVGRSTPSWIVELSKKSDTTRLKN